MSSRQESLEITQIVSLRKNVCSINLFVNIFLYAIVILGFERQWQLMLAYGVWSICIYSILLFSELRFKGLGLFALFFLGAIVRHAIPTVDHSLSAIDGARFSFFYDYSSYIFPAAIAMEMYYMLFVLWLTHFSRDKIMSINMSIFLQIKHFNVIAVIIYLIGIVYNLFPYWFDALGWMRMIFSSLCQIVLIALAYYCSYKDSKSSLFLFYTFIIINLLIAIFLGFYKGAIVMPLVTYGLYYILHNRVKGKNIITVKSVIVASITVSFILFFVYPFMTAKRYAAGWNPTEGVTSSYSNVEIIKDVLTGSYNTIAESSSERLSSRLNSLDCNAYFYMFANEYGHHQDVLLSCFRQYWPKWLGRDTENDIMLNPGYMIKSYIEDGHVVRNPTFSSANAGRFGAAYFWGGWPGAIFMCMFNAILISFLFQESKKKIRNVFALLLFLSILMGAIDCFEESTHSGGFSTALMWMIQYVLLYITSNIRFSHRKY